MGHPGDCDPRDDEPERECPECCDIFVEDGFGEWYCPNCKGKEEEK
jgi:hypothetical protein